MFKNCIQNKKKVFLDKTVLVLDGQVGRQVGSGLPIKEYIASRGMQIALLFWREQCEERTSLSCTSLTHGSFHVLWLQSLASVLTSSHGFLISPCKEWELCPLAGFCTHSIVEGRCVRGPTLLYFLDIKCKGKCNKKIGRVRKLEEKVKVDV